MYKTGTELWSNDHAIVQCTIGARKREDDAAV
jgi:hypothetical protein